MELKGDRVFACETCFEVGSEREGYGRYVPLVGNPIAALHTIALPNTSKFGCGSLIPCPTCATKGRMINAATVWLMNVATTRIKPANTTSTPYRLMPSTFSVIVPAIVWSRPELLTAFPSDKPPAARMIMVQRKLLKSSLVRMPVPKKRTIGMIATTPMSPKTCSSW